MDAAIHKLQAASAELAQLSGKESSVNLFADAKPGETPSYSFYGRVGSYNESYISESAPSLEELVATLRRKCTDIEDVNRRRVAELRCEAEKLGYVMIQQPVPQAPARDAIELVSAPTELEPIQKNAEERRQPGEPAMF
jgi:hypothetical protein